jgi:hypothetical protein
MASLVLSGDTSGTVTLAAPAVAGTQSYTLPTAVPAANGYALTSTTGGTMSWASVAATPAGSTTQVQYNSSGAFAGSANMTFNGTTLTLANDLTVGLGGYRLGTGGDASNMFFLQAGSSTVITGTAFQNTAMGLYSLSSQTGTGFTNNTAFGASCLRYLTTGTYNTAIGAGCGNSLTTGAGNVLLGSGANTSAASASQIVIGEGVTGQANSNVTIGNSLGKIYNAYTVNATWTQTSDGRLKNNIKDDSLGLSFINRLRPVTFNWKPSNEIDPSLPYYNEVNQRNTTTVIHGLIAQEVKAALDAEGCSTFNGWDAGNEDTIQAISREMFISPLIKAIQELSAKLDAANARIAALEAK